MQDLEDVPSQRGGTSGIMRKRRSCGANYDSVGDTSLGQPLLDACDTSRGAKARKQVQEPAVGGEDEEVDGYVCVAKPQTATLLQVSFLLVLELQFFV